MKCSMCGHEFSRQAGRSACASCPMSHGSCNLVKCPHCGFENAEIPAWIRNISDRLGGKNNNETKR